MNQLFEDIRIKFPFIALINVGTNEYIGIIQNQNTQVTSMYDYSKLKTEEEKKIFLEAFSKDLFSKYSATARRRTFP